MTGSSAAICAFGQKGERGVRADAYQTRSPWQALANRDTAADSGSRPGLSHTHAPAVREPPDSGAVAKADARKCRRTQTRNPMLLLRLPGSFLLRYAERQFLLLLIQEPPRRTRRKRPRTLVVGIDSAR